MTTTSFATPVERLATFFDPLQPRETYEDAEIDDIASLLERCMLAGSKCPRTYIVLRTIGELDLLDRLLAEGFTDQWFPVEHRGLPSFLSPSTKNKFVQSQTMVMTKSLDLELGRHRHFAPGEPLPFEILGRLGSGGYGQVDKIASKISFRQYALKRIRRRAAFGNNSKEAMIRFRSEIQIVKSIQHRHIIQYVGSYTDKTYLGLVMAPVADTDLNTFLEQTCVYIQTAASANAASSVMRLRDQALASEMSSTVRTYFGCLAAALSYLHDRSIKHKDVKPQNILVHKGNVLLTDFGLSRDFAEDVGSTTTGITPASPRYSPPEVAVYEARNTSADVWSLGCVFVEMAAALHGYNVDWIKQYYAALHTTSSHFHANPNVTSQLIREWESTWKARDRKPLQWVKSMLQMDRLSRPTAAQIFELATSSDELDQNPTTFCGICCVSDEDTDSCDSLVDEPTVLPTQRVSPKLTIVQPESEISTTASVKKGHTPVGLISEASASSTPLLNNASSGTAFTSDAKSIEGSYQSRETEPERTGLDHDSGGSRAQNKGRDEITQIAMPAASINEKSPTMISGKGEDSPRHKRFGVEQILNTAHQMHVALSDPPFDYIEDDGDPSVDSGNEKPQSPSTPTEKITSASISHPKPQETVNKDDEIEQTGVTGKSSVTDPSRKSYFMPDRPISRKAVPKSGGLSAIPASTRSRTKEPPRRNLRSWFNQFSKKSATSKNDPSTGSSRGIFGVSLTTSMPYANIAISVLNEQGESYLWGYIPIVVGKCVVFLKEMGTTVPGVLTTPGNDKNVKEIIGAFDSPPRWGKGLNWTEYTLFDSATVLHRYLMSLPDPLISKNVAKRLMFPAMSEQFKPPDPSEFDNLLTAYQWALDELGPPHRHLLLYLLDTFAIFVSKSDLNGTMIDHIAEMYHKVFFRYPEDDLELFMRQRFAIGFMIDNYDVLMVHEVERSKAKEEQITSEPKMEERERLTAWSPASLASLDTVRRPNMLAKKRRPQSYTSSSDDDSIRSLS